MESVNDDERIMDKIKRYLEEKEGLDLQSSYFLTKRINESFWEDICMEGEMLEVPEEDDADLPLDDVDDTGEIRLPLTPKPSFDEEEEVKPVSKEPKVPKVFVKRPKVSFKKESVSESEELAKKPRIIEKDMGGI